MITISPSYGHLIACRYRDCSNPLSLNESGGMPEVDQAGSIPQSDLAIIASRISLSDELGRDRRDSHGRFDERALPNRRDAAVDDLLARALIPCRERKFTVIFTHDVDRTTLCEATALAKCFLKIHPRNVRSTIGTMLNCRSHLARTIDELLRFEVENNICSIYFLLAGPYSLARYGSRTSITWRSAREIIRAVKSAGMEIGLHGSYYTMDTGSYASECRRLADAVQSPIRHHRNHYLRFDPRRLWGQLANVGIRYDHSVGFVNGWGLRTGTCVPYPAWDYAVQAPSSVIEIPMLLMDGEWTQRFDQVHIDQIRTLLESVRRHRGWVGINFHPELLSVNPAAWEYFRKLVTICHELGANMKVQAETGSHKYST